MRQRPLEDTRVALRLLGADATSELRTGCPPVVVQASGLRGGSVRVAGTQPRSVLSLALQELTQDSPMFFVHRREADARSLKELVGPLVAHFADGPERFDFAGQLDLEPDLPLRNSFPAVEPAEIEAAVADVQ
jgi:3-phosphoshikimate 1-carboxyvinyltransferase